MLSDWVPSTEQVRSHYVFDQSDRWDAERGEAFDRWKAENDQQVAAKAWDEGYDEAEHYERGNYGSEPPSNPYRTPEQPEGENRG